ncbi:sodium-dependent transporter [Ruminococcus sp. CLA-AA-H200]|uniref:Sodium-dependent transporter n=1 Tax=Ruminococcus turbiniformis TaxID=2881258 RepID=A0ABS8FXI0_9FIRM|nr:sodium-dependent transporter [Ruminococcus turbiniformis]MCC2254763.1 sodium-dependent transporter [Ruminococcus turbiniformis]
MNNGKKVTTMKEDKFNNKWGFIVSCIGSSVGMANIWMFPYRIGQFGGAAFLIPYFIFVVLIGFTGVIGEMAFGRAMHTGPLGAFRKAFEMRGSKAGTVIGLIPVIGSLGIAIGYSVIIGWILKFLADSITGSIVSDDDPVAVFTDLSRNFGSIPWHMLGLILVLICMSFGIARGIEKVNRIMMPAFFVLFLLLAVRVAFLDGALDGYSYLFKPDWSAMANPQTWVYAMGQAFFSLSVAGSGTVVYGSYLKSDVDVVSSAKYVAFFDTMAALLAGLVIIPAVFAYGMEPNSGPGLLFITIPAVIRSIPFGQLFAVIFFLAVLFAGATSLVNLLESPVEALQSRFGWSRKSALILVGAVTAAAGIFVEGDLLSPWMDSISIYVIPLGALLAGITMFWVCGKGFARNAVQLGRQRTLGRWFEPMTKYVFCGVALLVYVLGIFYGGIG